MKKLIVIAIFSTVSVFLSGCFNSKWLSDSEVFEKKKECANYDIKKDIEQNWWSYSKKYTIDEIFYSPKRNTCIWLVSLYSDNWIDKWLYDILQKDWFLNVVLDDLGNCWYWDDDVKALCIKNSEKFSKTVESLR